MDKKTLKGLLGSIRKWERIEVGEIGDGDEGVDNCDLCMVFYSNDGNANCEGCPVAEKTGSSYCIGSPYEQWARANRTLTMPWFADTDELKALAHKELEFLKGLLPEEAK